MLLSLNIVSVDIGLVKTQIFVTIVQLARKFIKIIINYYLRFVKKLMIFFKMNLFNFIIKTIVFSNRANFKNITYINTFVCGVDLYTIAIIVFYFLFVFIYLV